MKTIDKSLLKIEPRELKIRLLGADDSETLTKASVFEELLLKSAECKYTFRETSVNINDNKVTFDFIEIQSTDLARNLAGCSTAFIVAVTLGHGVDRLLRQASVKSATDLFFCDAVASALVEALCDTVQALLPYSTKARFSPGYGNLPLSLQRQILEFLNADGITLTEADLMIPTKSVTFIAGRK